MRTESKKAQSLMAMLEGNTHPDDIERLERVWLVQVKKHLWDLLNGERQ